VVGADGVESKAGGKVVKNVTGYDLNKLYTGSLGTLGVIVEATFKLAPRPDAGAALVASFPSVESGIDAGRSLIAQVYAPQGLQVVNRSAARQLGLDAAPGDGVVVLVFIAGRPRAVARRLEESVRLLRESGASEVDSLDDTASQSLLRQLTDLGWSDANTPYLGLKVNLPPDRVSKLVAALATTEDSGIVADPGFGVVQLSRWPEKTANDAGPAASLDNAAASGIVDEIDEIDRIRRAARSLGGTVVVEHCPPSVKAQIDVWGEPAANSESGAELEIMRRIKQNFDPSGILNPGRFIGKL
jgi:glycolate oxidase FAD binding subunit